MKLRTTDVCLAIAVLALVAAGMIALFGEFTSHVWRNGVRGANVSDRGVEVSAPADWREGSR